MLQLQWFPRMKWVHTSFIACSQFLFVFLPLQYVCMTHPKFFTGLTTGFSWVALQDFSYLLQCRQLALYSVLLTDSFAWTTNNWEQSILFPWKFKLKQLWRRRGRKWQQSSILSLVYVTLQVCINTWGIKRNSFSWEEESVQQALEAPLLQLFVDWNVF